MTSAMPTPIEARALAVRNATNANLRTLPQPAIYEKRYMALSIALNDLNAALKVYRNSRTVATSSALTITTLHLARRRASLFGEC